MGFRLEPRRFRLNDLGTTDLGAVAAHKRIEGDVLRLEGCDLDATIPKNSA